MVMGMPWSRLLRHIKRLQPAFTAANRASLHSFTSPPPPTISTSLPTSNAFFFFNRSRMRIISPFCTATNPDDDGAKDDGKGRGEEDDDFDSEYESDFPDVDQLFEELRKEETQEGAESEEDDDYMGLGEIKDEDEGKGDAYWSGEDEESDEEDDLDPEELMLATKADEKKHKQSTKAAMEYSHLLKSLHKSSTFDEAYKWMDQIDRFQAQHFVPSNEYKVLGWLLNRLNEATGKERFVLQMKIQRALKHLRWQAEFDPQNPDNWGIMRSENENTAEPVKEAEVDKEEDKEDKEDKDEDKEEDKENEGDQIKEKDDEYISDEDIEEALSEHVQNIDKEIKKKLAEMELTFGKQSRDLEEEIKELVGQRQSLTVPKDLPIYRKGFDVKLIEVNRTCKVTKAGQVQKYSAIVAVGNFNGIVGYAKAKGSRAVASAIQRAHVKSFDNLHYIDRYKEHTIAHAIQAKFKKTKIYLWPGAISTGMRANKTVESILYLAGLRNVKSKVIGSRNTENTVKALFKALNMIETPQDIQEKFGRSVVESYLLK